MCWMRYNVACVVCATMCLYVSYALLYVMYLYARWFVCVRRMSRLTPSPPLYCCQQARDLLRGEPDSTVSISFLRDGSSPKEQARHSIPERSPKPSPLSLSTPSPLLRILMVTLLPCPDPHLPSLALPLRQPSTLAPTIARKICFNISDR